MFDIREALHYRWRNLSGIMQDVDEKYVDETTTPRVQFRSLDGGEIVTFDAPAPYKTDEPNEDRLAVIEIDEDNRLLAVADGVGGMPKGEAAAASVIEHLELAFREPVAPGSVGSVAATALESAHTAIVEAGDGCASTVALAHISGTSYRSLHAGDSVVMVSSQRGNLKFETISHSPVGYALESGMLSEEDAFSHEERHVVSNLIGGDSLHITLGGTMELAPRDTLIVASDGVTDNLRQVELIDAIRIGNLKACGERLVAMVTERMHGEGKPDDMSFILYRRTPAKRRSQRKRHGQH
ncbi:MAG: PP2C family serine/threonine-protein phosphatase [Gammaproteobacteria bacterium]|nr:PP2C family serine/threonine-protein phosphatase [Gammaproteobacteria bacterium]